MIKRITAITLAMILLSFSFANAQAAAVKSVEAPKNLTVELKTEKNGYPYFQLMSKVPASVEALYKNASENGADLFYDTEFKIGNGSWESAGAVHFSEGPLITMNPVDMGIDTDIDIKANTYYFRIRFSYNQISSIDKDGNAIAAEPICSPYSNIFSIGITAYKYAEASKWAEAELDKAAEYGFITDKIKDKMNAPITREELCEVIMKFYEKIIGTPAGYKNLNAFTDTKNPDIYRAYELGIANGVGNNRFAPSELTNREQVASMMYRAVKAVKPKADFNTKGAESFKDTKLISSWALEPVKFMNKNGFLKGSNGNIGPKDNTTREQAVLIIVRTFEKYKN